jgi:hypothetical protein
MIGFGRNPVLKGMNEFRKKIITNGLVILLALSAHALTINVTYDLSVTNIGTLAQVQTAFGAAAQTIQNLYTNASTVNITVYAAGAGPFTNGVDLGASFSQVTGSSTFKYLQMTNALRAARTTVADSNSVASLPVSDPTGGTTNMWWVPRAEAKALNVLISPTSPSSDGNVGFATNENYTFDPNNRAVPGEIDFIGVAEHELTEVMGRSTFGLDSTNYVPYDLFRFTSSGVRSLDANGTGVYFSVDDGVTALKFFNPNDGGDIQDWMSSTPPDSFDAFVSDSEQLTLSAADLTSLDILGYKLNYVPPRLIGATLGNGTFQLNFTNTPGTTYTVLATTNLTLSVTNWTVLGTTTETLAGQFQFTDSQATNALRFYRVQLN